MFNVGNALYFPLLENDCTSDYLSTPLWAEPSLEYVTTVSISGKIISFVIPPRIKASIYASNQLTSLMAGKVLSPRSFRFHSPYCFLLNRLLATAHT